MNRLAKEPALAAGAVAAAVLGVLVVYGVLAVEQARAWEALLVVAIPLLQGWWTRAKSLPVATLHEAGISVETVQDRAADPNVAPIEG
jgi:hypothetical protein